MKKVSETQRWGNQKWIAERKSLGLCYSCDEPVAPGKMKNGRPYSLCHQHYEEKYGNVGRRKGQKTRKGLDKKAAQKLYRENYFAKKAAHGLCVFCKSPVRPGLNRKGKPFLKCDYHYQKDIQAGYKSKKKKQPEISKRRKKTRQERKQNLLCTRCGEKVKQGLSKMGRPYTLCAAHHEEETRRNQQPGRKNRRRTGSKTGQNLSRRQLRSEYREIWKSLGFGKWRDAKPLPKVESPPLPPHRDRWGRMINPEMKALRKILNRDEPVKEMIKF